MTAHAPDVCATAVLVVCADRNFQRYARAVLRQGGHAVFLSGVRAADVAVLVRLRAPQVVVLDVDHRDAGPVRAALGRTALVAVGDEPGGETGATVGKWDSSLLLLDAVEQAAAATRRRSLLRVVRP